MIYRVMQVDLLLLKLEDLNFRSVLSLWVKLIKDNESEFLHCRFCITVLLLLTPLRIISFCSYKLITQ